jgi:hypothetical protein
MSKISELRENPNNQINLVKIMEKIFPNQKTKYTEMFTRIIREHYANMSSEGDFKEHIAQYDVDGLNPLEQLFLVELVQHILEEDEINRWKYFCNKFESNAIQNVDLQTLDFVDLAEIIDEQFKIDELKALERQAMKLLDDKEWLVVIPLTHEASMKYGAKTKWCTTSTDGATFDTYAKDGLLFYLLNKVTNEKHAMYYEIRDKSQYESNLKIFNAEDDCVELIFLDIPYSVIKIVRSFLEENDITTHDLSKKVASSTMNFKISDFNGIQFDVETLLPSSSTLSPFDHDDTYAIEKLMEKYPSVGDEILRELEKEKIKESLFYTTVSKPWSGDRDSDGQPF